MSTIKISAPWKSLLIFICFSYFGDYIICENKFKEDGKMRFVPIKREREFYPMLSLFDNFVHNFWDEDKSQESQRAMAIDIVEHDDKYDIQANLPGFKKEDIDISIKDNELVIEANHEEKKEEKKGSYCRCERYKGNYRRVLAVPDFIDEEKINAKFADGILSIAIPKKESKPVKEIKIG